MKTHLLGFTRDTTHKIEPVYGENPTFRDINLDTEMTTHIVPLTLKVSDQPWQCAQTEVHLPAPITTLIENNQVLATDPEATDANWALLMVSPKDSPEMSRSGVLLHRASSEQEFEPLIATLSGAEFVVELKGPGAPTGGFPSFHLRNQAGAYLKAHLRITGGSDWEGILTEHTQLMQVHDNCSTAERPSQLLPLAAVPMALVGDNFRFELGELLRLSPGSIRYSYTDNKALDKKQNPTFAHYLNQAGKCVAQYLKFTPAAVHRNASWNNMVVLPEHNLVLSDLEELTPCTVPHCNLDFPDYIFPYALLKYGNDDSAANAFADGVNAVEKDSLKLNSSTPYLEQLWQWNTQQWQKMAPDIVSHRLEHPFDTSQIIENRHASKSFAMPTYWKAGPEQWVKTELVPALALQYEFLAQLADGADDEDLSEYNQFIETGVSEGNMRMLFTVLQQSKDLVQELTSGRPSPYGRYVTKTTFRASFLRPIPTLEALGIRVGRLNNILEAVQNYVETGSLSQSDSYITTSIDEQQTLLESDAALQAHPFLMWVNVLLHNETTLLSAEGLPKSPLLQQSRDKIADLKATLKTNPMRFAVALCQSDEALLNLLWLPYWRK